MRALHTARPPWPLSQELVQNAWDKIPPATFYRAQRIPGPDGSVTVTVTVSDDSPGFANLKDARTLMGDTAKRSAPGKRGRFNLGEKEIISAARSASMDTVGGAVQFPTLDGRADSPAHRANGTSVTCHTDIHILARRHPEAAWLYDLGIPVQSCTAPMTST